MPTPSEPVWNSLEVAKLFASGLTPIVVVLVGWWLDKQLKRFDHMEWANQKIVEKRLSVYSDLVPKLNDLLCYFTFVGCWKELSPPDVVKLKRDTDRIVHINAALFSEEFYNKYNAFVNLCFSTYSGWGEDAKLRTLSQRRQEAHGDKWLDEWMPHFSTEQDCSKPEHIKASYSDLITNFSKELGVGLSVSSSPSRRLPTDIK